MNHADEARAARVRALRDLPELEPPADGWPRLAARLAPRPSGARSAIGLALAAAAAALGTLALLPALERTAAPAPAPAAGAAAALAATPDLRARSADLERLLDALPPPTTARASTAATTALLEDRIALVDERLSAAGALPAAESRALWRERVLLLDSLVRVRYADSVGQAL